MKTEIILLIKYLISIYLLSFVFFTVVQKIHNLYYPKNKNINRCSNKKNNNNNRNINDKLNKYNNKCSSKNKRLTKEERKRIERKYKLRTS